MTIQQVLYVLEIASRSSVSQAAQKLYLSQSALSQQLRRLEEELGYPLFSRTYRTCCIVIANLANKHFL